MRKNNPRFYPIEEVYKLLDDSYTFVVSPRYYGKITYLKRRKNKKKPRVERGFSYSALSAGISASNFFSCSSVRVVEPIFKVRLLAIDKFPCTVV